MSLKTRKQVLLAKLESTYGTDPTPTGASNAILCTPMQLTPLDGSTIERNNVRAYYGARHQIHVGEHVSVALDVELAGSGAAGTAPSWAPLLRACGWAETIVASTSVTYKPLTDAEPSVTIWAYADGQRHILTGARGEVSLRLNRNEIPYLSFNMMGIYNAPGAVSNPAVTLSGFQDPLKVDNTNTTTFSLHSTSVPMEGIEISNGNELVFRQLVGATDEVAFVDRKMGGNVTIEAPALGTKNYFAIAKANTLGAISIVHGTSAGNILTISGAGVQLLQPAYGDTDGVLTLGMGLSFQPTSAGNDELILAFT